MVHTNAGIINGVGNTVTDAYNLLIDAAPAGTATITRSWSFGVMGNARFLADVAIGTMAPSALLHLAGVTAVAGTASLKINAGVLLAATELGAVESNGVNLFWTDAAGIRCPLNASTLVPTTVSAVGPYVVLASDTYLRVTQAAAISINLPAVAASANRMIGIGDTRYNAAGANITLVLGAGGDKINNANANYVMSISGQVLWLVANAVTGNWELV